MVRRKSYEPAYEESLRSIQRSLLAEAARDIVGMEYGQEELTPYAATLVVYGPDSTVAVWDVNLTEGGEDLTAVQTAGVLTAGLTAVVSYLVEQDVQQRDMEEEEEDDE